MDHRQPGNLDLEILICTHNRVSLLERVIASLNKCDVPEECNVGILVVPNACSDDTISFLRRYNETMGREPQLRLPLRWIEDPVPGKSHALNTALPQTRGRMVAFVDDDHRVDSGFFKAICAADRSYPDTDLFCGRILPDWDGSEPSWVHDQGKYRIYPLPVPRFELGSKPRLVEPGTAIPGGGNIAIRRGLFEKVGPYRLELGPQGHNLAGAEDIEWVSRAIAGGSRLQYLPDMLQYHYVDSDRLTLTYILRKAHERSFATVRLQRHHQGPFGVPPYMIRKSLVYLLKAITSLASTARRRFYLTRLAASLGEIKGAYVQYRRGDPATEIGGGFSERDQ